MGWWRNYIRAKTKQIPMERAMKAKGRLSAAYFFVAWNAFALAVYLAVKESNPRTEEEEKHPSKYYNRLIRPQGEITVRKYKGFTLVDEYKLDAIEKPQRGRTWEERNQMEMEREERERKEKEEIYRPYIKPPIEDISDL